MKNIFYLLLLVSCVNSAQELPENKLSIAVNGNFAVAMGNNFMTKSYSNEPGFEIETEFVLKKVFFGVVFQKSYLKLKNPYWIGNFNTSDGFNIATFVGFRQKTAIKEIYFEHRIGIGYKEIVNYSDIGNYSISGTFFTIGSKINYTSSKQLHFFVGLDFHYCHYDIPLTGPYKSFYSNSYQLTPNVGLKYFLW